MPGHKHPEPDRVGPRSIEQCRFALSERSIKRVLRFFFIKYLRIRFGFETIGEGFRWGKNWDVRKGILSIGRYVYIGPRVQIIYPTVIGDLTLIAADVQFIGNDHGFLNSLQPMRISPPAVDPMMLTTKVMSDVWIGQRTIILHGITIGRGSIIAAGSVVTRDVPEYSIVSGVPARLLRMRFTPELIKVYSESLYKS